jgi:hypothetical protein
MLVIKTCSECKRLVEIAIQESDFEIFRTSSISIQKCFPYLTFNEREILLSGVCGRCYDNFF